MKLLVSVIAYLIAMAHAVKVNTTSSATTSQISKSISVKSRETLSINTNELLVKSLNVNNSGEFLLNLEPPGKMAIESVINNGFILIDTRQVDQIDLPFRKVIMDNYGEKDKLVIYGKDVNVKIDEVDIIDDNSMIFWGDSGNVFLKKGYIRGNTCFHSQLAILDYVKLRGCTALRNSTVYINNTSEDFLNLVFEGSNNGVWINTTNVTQIDLANFGNGNYVAVPDDSYDRFGYIAGEIMLFFKNYYITLNIGYDYNLGDINVTKDSSMVYVRYNKAPPIRGANDPYCSCVLHTKEGIEGVATESIEKETSEVEESAFAETDDSDDTSSTNVSSGVFMPIYALLQSLILLLIYI
ncbi:uncharacterized protein SPAPADRAFT_67770 [Spathaspora passalidarum NRRL Y-27907]|uniref:Hyphally-regulated cell wall protein N-terminal domain-containing protein n=1 Tax=Spathaspora passalidarum (strain NRRL Y-27907 / 11-Y1) TaxID=619300 RepID=G3ARD8_SPAPN|nr:uncharacterized protein SPAPADRAFT_67770 [Spathaspora passalidarum NRRL Y-27907]EGW31745.1 hypothetical protein SPAPADRAFT_67770 [Spathaspora passalidarum NRRL Y-27907]